MKGNDNMAKKSKSNNQFHSTSLDSVKDKELDPMNSSEMAREYSKKNKKK